MYPPGCPLAAGAASWARCRGASRRGTGSPGPGVGARARGRSRADCWASGCCRSCDKRKYLLFATKNIWCTHLEAGVGAVEVRLTPGEVVAPRAPR